MALFIIFASLAIAVVVGAARLRVKSLKTAAAFVAPLLLIVGVLLSSVRRVNSDEVGIVVKNIGSKSLQGGAYIAINGEQGVQADVLSPGWHFWYWPFVYDVRAVKLTEVPAGSIGIVDSKDGLPMPSGQVIAPEWPTSEFNNMLDARYFLTIGKGLRGTQASVLTPGKYRINSELFKVKTVPITEVLQGEVAVLKANFGTPPSSNVAGIAGLLESAALDKPEADRLKLAKEGEMGIRELVLPPGKYPINTEAYTVVEILTTQMMAQFTAAHARAADAGQAAESGPGRPANKSGHDPSLEERAITVRTSDGFTFPVDVRIEYVIEPQHAPIVVAKLGDDEGDRFRNALNSAVRAIFRNNAESVRALDYVQQRSHQESQSLSMLAAQMARFGVTVTAVRIGDVGDEKTLGALLKTQTDREIAKQELITFREQQKAAEQQRQLSRATQEAEEEKRLATAAYGAKIAEETRKQRLTEAGAEAESITIKAKAQADAYRLIAEQIGKSNAALIEVLKIVGEKGIQIAPRVMVTGEVGEGATLVRRLLGRCWTRW